MKKNEDLRKIPTKNYIIVGIMFILFFAFLNYLYSWYKVYTDYERTIPVIGDTLLELNSNEVEHYIQENPKAVVYLCSASDNDCRSFEKTFKKLINSKSLNNYIVYVNLENEDRENFTNNFNDYYDSKKKLKNSYPAIVVFEDAEVIDIIQAKVDEKLSINHVEKFLNDNYVGELT